MKKLTVLVILALVLFTSCSAMFDVEEESSEPKNYSIGATVRDAGVEIRFVKVAVFTDALEKEIFAIYITIKNTTKESISYSSANSWGGIIASDGFQISGVNYIEYNQYFIGYSILPGATITDVLTFNAYSGQASSFIFYANPPITDFKDFTLSFTKNEILPGSFHE